MVKYAVGNVERRKMSNERIFLSPPCVGAEEREAVGAAFDSRYVAPCGPMVDELERRLAEVAGRRHAVVVSSGTAALDLAMAEFGVDSSWTVIASTLTFIATVGPAFHRGARIVFVDCDETGNMDPALLEQALAAESECQVPGARHLMVITVDLYGRCCDYGRIAPLCEKYGAVLIGDAAEAVGASRAGRKAGSAGAIGIFSFNGNKIITTSGGGALLTDDEAIAQRARKRSQQSREPFAWYQHEEVGYNYRMSNILAAVGLAQLAKLPRFIRRRGEIKAAYAQRLELLPSVEGENNWLAVALLKSEEERDAILAALAAADIEARPVWKPLHLQPVFKGCKVYGGAVSEGLFRRGICLPTGSGMTDGGVGRVLACIAAHRGARGAEAASAPSCIVMGRGRSGRAAEALLRRKGFSVTVLDGEDAFPDGGFAFAVASPGIAPDHRWMEECRRRGVAVMSELQLGVEELRRLGVKLLAVTGSKGKSSVVKLVADALGGVPCGNYGTPVCDVALLPAPPAWAVVEVSSFQMETTLLPSDAFEAAAVLNLQEDHLDRHGSVEAYHALKRRLLDFTRTPLLCQAPDASALFAGTYFDNDILRLNGSIAAALLRTAGLADGEIRRAFAAFTPLPHRMNVVLVCDGVTYIDDSKATSIAALAAGVVMAGRNIRLIAGGLGKGDDVKIAIPPLRERVKKVYTIGRSAESLVSAWSGAVPCEVCGTLENAVSAVMRDVEAGDCVLLSPGAASFDQFNSFGERGDTFANLVKKGKDKR